jgi:microcystin-dependent protein
MAFAIPKTFVAGTSAKASDVNENFDAIEQVVNQLLDAVMPVGSVIATARASAPTGFLICEGQAVSRSKYSALFGAIGTAYGKGDGSTTFNLPDLRGRVPAGVDNGAGRIGSNKALGQAAGDSRLAKHTHTFTTNGRAVPHQHTVGGHITLTVGNGGTSTTTVDLLTRGGTSEQTSFQDIVHDHGGTTDSVGQSPLSTSGDANMPPYQVVNWAIKV